MAEKVTDEVFALDRKAWRKWLEANHASSKGVWLIFNKKATGKPYLSYDEQVEEALCFGWVDSKPRTVDDECSSLYFAPRKAKSGWSQLNKERIQKLSAAGWMTPAGMAKIEDARKDGSWEKLDGVEALEVPPDLAAAFKLFAGSKENFEAFPRSVKRGILEWIVQAKRPETRAKRVEETARLAAENIRANQWR